VALALVAGCHKNNAGPTANGSGETVALAGSGSAGAGSATATPPAPPKDVAKALDDALATKHLAPDAVLKRIASPTSAWAVVANKKNAAQELLSVDVIASRGNGIAEVHIDPPSGNKVIVNGLDSLESKDLDGNGIDEGLLVLDWTRVTNGAVRVDESGRQLYVIGGAAQALRVAFTHLISYKSTSTALDEDNPTPTPGDEEVTYDWKVAPGTPPVVTLERTKSEIAAQDRLAGMLDPAHDPLFAAGSGKDLPIVLP
jgi:hypothetical protein